MRPRGVLALASVALLLTSALGLLATAYARAEFGDLRVGEPRQGDRFAYGTPEGALLRAFAWNGTRAAFDEWGRGVDVDLLEVTDRDGSVRYGYPGGAALPIFYDSPGAGGFSWSGSEPSEGVFPENRSSMTVTNGVVYYGAFRQPSPEAPCLERAGWQGMRLSEVARTPFASMCPTGEMRVRLEARDVDEFRGVLAQRFVVTGPGFAALAFWLAPGIPYPVGIADCQGLEVPFCDAPDDAHVVLLGYKPGQGGALLPSAHLRPAPHAPRLEPFPASGVPDVGFSEFPPEEALAAIEGDASLQHYHAWRREHPDARLVSASHTVDLFRERPSDPFERWSFRWAASDGTGQDAWVDEDEDCRAAPPLPVVLPPELRGECRPLPGDQPPFSDCPCRPRVLPERVLTFESAVRMFEARRESPEEPLYAYSFDLRPSSDGRVDATILVTAVTMAEQPEEDEGAIPPLFGRPGGAGAGTGESVLFDALTGRAIYQTYTATKTQEWRTEPGLLGVAAAPASVRTASSRVAFGVAGVPDEVYATSATLAIGALLALVAGRLVPACALLYTRLRRADVLAHPRRKALLDAIRASPGLTIQEAGAATGMRGGALRHHLAVLVRAGRLVRVDCGGRALHFLGGEADHRRLVEAAVLQSEGAEARVLERVRARPGVHAALLAQELGVSRAAIHLSLRRLERRGLLRTVQAGRRKLLYLAG